MCLHAGYNRIINIGQAEPCKRLDWLAGSSKRDGMEIRYQARTNMGAHQLRSITVQVACLWQDFFRHVGMSDVDTLAASPADHAA